MKNLALLTIFSLTINCGTLSNDKECTAQTNEDGSHILTCGDESITIQDGKDGTSGKDGEDGKDGTNGQDGTDAIYKIVKTIECTASIYYDNARVIYEYKVHELSSGDVMSTAMFRSNVSGFSASEFYSSNHAMFPTARVMVWWSAFGGIYGHFCISLDRETLVTHIKYKDDNHETTWDRTPEDCIVNEY